MQAIDLKVRPILVASVLAGVFSLSGCEIAKAPAPIASSGLEVVMERLPGTYSNQVQYQAAPDDLKVEPQIGSEAPWIDYQFAEFKRVDVPAVSGEVVALQWRRQGREGPISRQRLWAFRSLGDALVMDFYSLKSEIDFTDEAAISSLAREDLISYGDKCALPVRSTEGALRMAIPETCQIVSRSGRNMTLSAEITIGEGLTYKESGWFPSGDLVFMVPGIEAYAFERVEE